MTDTTNVITVTQPNLDWINANVLGSSKRKRLEELLRFYQERHNDPVVALTREDMTLLEKWAKEEGCSVNETLHRILDSTRRS
jgi:hypothetical protein